MLAILIATLLLSPYFLIPLFMSQAFRNGAAEKKWLWLSYLFTAILLFVYPDLMFWTLSLFREPLKEGQFLCMFPPIFINVPLLPLALLFQWGFNRYFTRSSVKV